VVYKNEKIKLTKKIIESYISGGTLANYERTKIRMLLATNGLPDRLPNRLPDTQLSRSQERKEAFLARGIELWNNRNNPDGLLPVVPEVDLSVRAPVDIVEEPIVENSWRLSRIDPDYSEAFLNAIGKIYSIDPKKLSIILYSFHHYFALPNTIEDPFSHNRYYEYDISAFIAGLFDWSSFIEDVPNGKPRFFLSVEGKDQLANIRRLIEAHYNIFLSTGYIKVNKQQSSNRYKLYIGRRNLIRMFTIKDKRLSPLNFMLNTNIINLIDEIVDDLKDYAKSSVFNVAKKKGYFDLKLRYEIRRAEILMDEKNPRWIYLDPEKD
jgi:hypothetical protein